MSASLVGSEMCIRDRSCLAFSNPGAERPCRQGRRTITNIERGNRLDSVSYTHLTLPTICSV
eukprot:14102225-Alexandrium_andersonii.AAC.1